VSRHPSPWPLSELVPHAPPLVLVDEIVEYDDTSLVAVVGIGADHIFFAEGGVPAHVGIEFMAQACAAWSGAMGKQRGEPVRPGMLLGTRGYEATIERFSEGDRLIVTVALNFRDEELGVFDCVIERGGETVASAQLTVYQPSDAAAFMARVGNGHV